MANLQEIKVPDIGSSSNVSVIEIQVKPGDTVEKEQSLITLEGEKATMEIPSPVSGVVKEIKIKVGDKVSMGHVILTMEASDAPAAQPAKQAAPAKSAAAPTPAAAPPPEREAHDPSSMHAGPAVRSLARELDIDLNKIKGTGRKGRVSKEDLMQFIKSKMSQGAGLPEAPVVDFSQFGQTEIKELSKIKKWTATNLSRNWLLIPHVTQFDQADITDLEAYRKAQTALTEKEGYKITVLAFVMKAVVSALQKFPQFNASYDSKNNQLILKKYFHIGVAVDTEDGLVVPVIRDCDKKDVAQLAKELNEISKKARAKQITPMDMQGGSFTISSLGGIGGTAFTPIINMPEVAILGLSKATLTPVYADGQLVPRLLLPLSLSYDHRVIDGAEGARFITFLSATLKDTTTFKPKA